MKYRMSDNRIIFRFCGCDFSLSRKDNNLWRLQTLSGNEFDDNGAVQTLSADLGEDFSDSSLEITAEELGGVISVRSDDGTEVRISEESIDFYDRNKAMKRRVAAFKQNDNSAVVELNLWDGECIYGTGERFNKVDQRGKKIHIYAIDKWCQTEGNSYIPVPFFLSSNSSAAFFNRYEHSVADIGKSDKAVISFEQKYAPIDMYVFLHDTPAGILRAYSDLSGHAPMPPEWAFGTLVCRYHPEFSTPEGVLSMAEAMDNNDFPWDAVIMEGWGIYNKSKWPELKSLSEKLHASGKKVMVYEQCGKFPSNAEADFGLSDSVAVQSDLGTELRQTRSMNLLDNFHRKKMKCVDLTMPESVRRWTEIWDEIVSGIGIDGAKIDFCEQFPDKEIIYFNDGRNPMAAHHWFPVLYNIIRFKHFSQRPDGGLNFSRGGGIGAQRYPFVWAGDQRREFFFLKAVIKAALSCGLSGIPFVGWDMAGYQPSFNPYDKLKENAVFLRGLEFTAFSPVIQTHGRVKRPYDFDEHTKAVYRAYSKIHEALRPYLLEQAEISCETGLPLMRHLFLYDSEDIKCRNTEDEYMLGEGLLVAPVLNKSSKRDIYLPAGHWKDIFSGAEYVGPVTLKNQYLPLEAVGVFSLTDYSSENLEKSLKACKPFIEEINNLRKSK